MGAVLIADPDVWDTILEREFIGGGDIEIAHSSEDAEAALRRTDTRILILDPEYPHARSLAVLAKDARVGRGVIPVLCVSDWNRGGQHVTTALGCDHAFEITDIHALPELIDRLLAESEA